ncbi:hypothetical protein [Photobacterium rosenbergii]|uniref:Uncharacterized protein n=1 Tax=Photobacterium rosenbergii TaxID=294936 RepID=A0ABU3ZLT6_9GAMM|nr:hypothetical protein [Photobacterium rosenbergii]MDV5170982.1 hypothetical protein [Photobacterium rosenbergii]
MSKSMFFRTVNGAVNLVASETVLYDEQANILLVLGKGCSLLRYDNSDKAEDLFKQLKGKVKPEPKQCIKMENGGFINIEAIKDIRLSEKSGSLLVSGTNDKLLHIFDAEHHTNLEGLRDVLVDGLISANDGKAMPKVDWALYHA